MLTANERDIVYAALVQFVLNQAQPRSTIVAGLVAELAEKLDAGSPQVVVNQAIQLCIEDDYRLNPPAMIRLLSLVAIRDTRIPTIIDRLRSGPLAAPSADPFAETILFTKLPFLERTVTRRALKALLKPTPDQPFVVVNGFSKFGKSYTADFIDHVLRDQADLLPCVVRIAPKTGAAVGPVDLARDLVSSMGGNPDGFGRYTNESRVLDELVNWVTTIGMKDRLKWWIILDGFNKDELRADTREFIAALAKRFTTALPSRHFRLILLDFDHSALPVQPGRIKNDTVDPIPQSAVKSFLDDAFKGAAQPIDVPKLLAKVTRGLGDPIRDLPELAERLTDVIMVAEAGR